MLIERNMKEKATASYTSTGYEDEEDRLSSLPDELLIRILSFIDIKLAIQSSVLSKRWVNVNLWTHLPVLNFDSSTFKQDEICTVTRSTPKITFDTFIDKVLAYRNGTIKIDGVNIKVTDRKTMARVFNYALMNGVPSLSIDSSEYLARYRPISCLRLNDSLMRLTLIGMMNFGRYLKFSGLVKLRLERVRIVESEPFSCFPSLEELFLVNCKLFSDMHVLEVSSVQLWRLTIFSCFYHRIPYEKIVLLTPKLRLFELDGLIPMSFEAPELPVLDTVHIDCCFLFSGLVDRKVQKPDEDQQKVNLIKSLSCLRNAKYVHLSPSTVKLLSLWHGKLAQEPCPFVNLKVLNLIPPPNKPVAEIHSSVANYLLKGSPGVVVKALPR